MVEIMNLKLPPELLEIEGWLAIDRSRPVRNTVVALFRNEEDANEYKEWKDGKNASTEIKYL